MICCTVSPAASLSRMSSTRLTEESIRAALAFAAAVLRADVVYPLDQESGR
jgi:hypothetical protein